MSLYLLSTATVVGAIGAVYYVATRIVFALDKDEQLIVKRLTTTEVFNGPGIHFISPLVKSAARRKAELLQPLDYLKIKDTLTGTLGIVRGPCAAHHSRRRTLRARTHALTPPHRACRRSGAALSRAV